MEKGHISSWCPQVTRGRAASDRDIDRRKGHPPGETAKMKLNQAMSEMMDNDEYVWKVLLAECFIKFYMDHFNVLKAEAEIMISETPLHKEDGGSDDENSIGN